MSRSTIRSRTQPTRPAELRTRYQSSITGFGGSCSSFFAAPGNEVATADLLGAGGGAWAGGCCFDGSFEAVEGAGLGLIEELFTGDVGAFGGFFSAVARFMISTFSPSFSW